MKKLSAIAAIVTACLCGANVARANDGDLDTSWGGTGVVTVPIGSNPIGHIVAPYGSSKVVVAGFTDMLGSGPDASFLARFLEDGTPDTTCAGTGRAYSSGASSFLATDMVVLPNGSVVVVGNDFGAPSMGVVAMFDPACQLDTNFGFGGIVTYTERDGVGLDAVALGPNDTIVIGGRVYFAPVDGGDSRPLIMRLTADGSFDTTFGDASSGRWVATANHEGYVIDLLVKDNGAITFTGVQFDATENQMVGQLTLTGAMDSAFASAGWYVHSAPNAERSQAMARRMNGSFIIAGIDVPESGTSLTESEGTILCLTVTGALDLSCGGTGRVTFSLDGGDDGFWDIAPDDQGRFVISGFVSLSSNGFVIPSPVVMRLNPDMSIDATFGGTGSMVVPWNHGHLFGVARDSSGRILAAGSAYVGGVSEARVVRLDAANAPTTSTTPPVSTVAPQLLPATGHGADMSTPALVLVIGFGMLMMRRRVRNQPAK